MRRIRQKWPTLKIENPSDDEIARMNSLWHDYKLTHIPSIAHLTVDLVHKWEDWAIDHYGVEALR